VVEAAATITQSTAPETLHEAMRQGFTFTVRTRVEVHEHRIGPHPITYADKLQVRGHKPVPPELREAMVTHRDELLAAACVIRPPVGWLEFLVGRYCEGRAPLKMVAANVAAFIGSHPAHDGPRLEAIIEEALG
jgi:hypothetical protein